jgi:hypothetical protein
VFCGMRDENVLRKVNKRVLAVDGDIFYFQNVIHPQTLLGPQNGA